MLFTLTSLLVSHVAGLYLAANFGCNLGYYACRILSPLSNAHNVPQGRYSVKT